ncbi:hypothetical protein [Polyangium jinanense]|uniref:Uncharacterized protein n=1 Tax=Polyangium jinanense TaxID=2829994 RepID=A0A9X3X548_9BACT|nr:hypothetical protein [Polyangium jinanense]MDC3984462.1 hypothetical protein [Polyangium jinanense]
MPNDPSDPRPPPHQRSIYVAPNQKGQVICLIPRFHWYSALLPSERDVVEIRVRDSSGEVAGALDVGPEGMQVDGRRRIDFTRFPPTVDHEISIGTEHARHAPRLRMRIDALCAAFINEDAGSVARAITVLPPDEE